MTEQRAAQKWLYGLLATPIAAISGCGGPYSEAAPTEAYEAKTSWCVYRYIDGDDEVTQGSRSAAEMIFEIVGVVAGEGAGTAETIAAAIDTAVHKVGSTSDGYEFDALRLRPVLEHEVRDGKVWHTIGGIYTVWARPTA